MSSVRWFARGRRPLPSPTARNCARCRCRFGWVAGWGCPSAVFLTGRASGARRRFQGPPARHPQPATHSDANATRAVLRCGPRALGTGRLAPPSARSVSPRANASCPGLLLAARCSRPHPRSRSPSRTSSKLAHRETTRPLRTSGVNVGEAALSRARDASFQPQMPARSPELIARGTSPSRKLDAPRRPIPAQASRRPFR